MTEVSTPIHALTDIERSALIATAAKALAEGKLVILPTETVYGVAANAASVEALDRLRSLMAAAGQSLPDGLESTWHAPSAARVLEVVPLASPVHRRAIERLAPGPVRFLAEVGGDDAAKVVRSLSASAAVFDRSGTIAFRVPDHEIAREVIARAGVPVIAERLGAFGWGDGRDASEALRDDRARRAGIAMVLDDGPTRLGRPSTTVRLTRAGGYAVAHEGALDARTVHNRIEWKVLFVCTGNTCRSPMAEAIGRGLAEQAAEKGPMIPTTFRSAGLSAAPGAPIAEQSREVMGEMGFPITQTRARELTRDMILNADAIYGMTRDHVRGALSLVPEASGKVFTIDPSGKDVPDPIGGPLEVYRLTARRLAEAIALRLKEASK